MAFLNRTELLKKDIFKIERVDLPNGDYVFVRQMNAKMKDSLESSIMVVTEKGDNIEFTKDLTGFRAKLVALCVCDEEGNSILSLKDAAVLAENKSSETLEIIANKISALNGMAVMDKVKAIKNLDPAQEEGSSFVSVKN